MSYTGESSTKKHFSGESRPLQLNKNVWELVSPVRSSCSLAFQISKGWFENRELGSELP